MRLTPPVTACLNCGRPITTTPGKRAKLYCDPSCKSNYRQKQQRLAKKEAELTNAKKKLKHLTEKPVKLSGKLVHLEDLTKPTGKKVVSDPPPKTNVTINTMPVKMKGENAIDFASRKNEWKRKQK